MKVVHPGHVTEKFIFENKNKWKTNHENVGGNTDKVA